MSKKTETKKQKMNKFEETRLLSARGLELTKGAQSKVKIPKDKKRSMLSKDYVKVAKEELEKGVSDLEIYK